MPRRVFSSPLSKLCFWGFTWIPFRCRPVWLLPDFQFPLQARPSCLSEYLPQVARPHGSGLPCAAPRVAPHEAVPLVDESAEDPPHGTSYSPNQGVTLRHFSPEWSRNGCVSPSPYDYNGRIDERLGRSLFEGRLLRGEWTGEFLSWHINCLELRAVFLALIHSLPILGKHHVIVRTDNMAVVSHINRQGGSRSRTLDRLACRLLLWSQDKFLSLRALHVPGILNLAADFLLRLKLRPGEWMLNRQRVAQIWDLFGKAEVEPLCFTGVIPMPALVLSKFPGNSGHRCGRPSVAEHETVRISASQADSSSPMQGEGERCPSPTHSPILAFPNVVLRADSSSVSAPLGDSDQAGPALSASGQGLASSARDLEAVGMAHTGSRALISSLPVEVQETIASVRAPATRKLYSSKWRNGL